MKDLIKIMGETEGIDALLLIIILFLVASFGTMLVKIVLEYKNKSEANGDRILTLHQMYIEEIAEQKYTNRKIMHKLEVHDQRIDFNSERIKKLEP